MSENKERAKGFGEEITGKAKQAMGNLTGNEEQASQGRAQESQGEARQQVAKGVGQAKGTFEETKGNVKQGIGGFTDNDSMQAEGQWDETKGETRRTFNQ